MGDRKRIIPCILSASEIQKNFGSSLNLDYHSNKHDRLKSWEEKSIKKYPGFVIFVFLVLKNKSVNRSNLSRVGPKKFIWENFHFLTILYSIILVSIVLILITPKFLNEFGTVRNADWKIIHM